MSAHWECRRVRVRGTVQGVGFRPFVWRLASELGLDGWVRNDGEGVEIVVEGPQTAVGAFCARLPREAPAAAHIQALYIDAIDARSFNTPLHPSPAAPFLTPSEIPSDCGHENVSDFLGSNRSEQTSRFRILPSVTAPRRPVLAPDLATCDACLRELFDPGDRRWRYPFIACAHCGPRYSMTTELPYDRARTTMSEFPLCPECAREYGDPGNRRFHAEATACPACGPRLRLIDAQGQELAHVDAIAATLRALYEGAIVAIKGLGGYHLACLATDKAAVARLRARKERSAKPLAVMAANVASLQPWVELDAASLALLRCPQRPIVLLPKRPGADDALAGVAPGLAWLGAMLPYTPLHWLLFHEAAGRPAGTAWLEEAQPLLLVMTSANPSGEPIVCDNDMALARLRGIADLWLEHDRKIAARCDDSVLRPLPVALGAPFLFLRRARGFVPQTIPLAHPVSTVLALGGYLKNTVCLTLVDEAILSPHVGSLDNPDTCAWLAETARTLVARYGAQPQAVAHDAHPDFFSTHLSQRLAEEWQVPAIAVQHHHAHIAAIAAEHRHEGPLLGLALDGVGWGPEEEIFSASINQNAAGREKEDGPRPRKQDGGLGPDQESGSQAMEWNGWWRAKGNDAAAAVFDSPGQAWGGELLWVEGPRAQRLGHLRPLILPGGDRAAKAPWRLAAAVLHALGRSEEIPVRFAQQPDAAALAAMLTRGYPWPRTTSLGRWFDAAAALLGLCWHNDFEAHAAMLLESAAQRFGEVPPLADGFVLEERPDGRLVLDLLPLMARLAEASDPGWGAAVFHATLAEALVVWVQAAAQRRGLSTVALGGGCWCNALLSTRVCRRLTECGITALRAQQVPPNDGGLSLGQAWVAALRLGE